MATAREDLKRAIANVQKAAEADTTRTGQAHADLLAAVRELTRAVETPEEKLMRMRFEVRFLSLLLLFLFLFYPAFPQALLLLHGLAFYL